jgi:hypothetical protein
VQASDLHYSTSLPHVSCITASMLFRAALEDVELVMVPPIDTMHIVNTVHQYHIWSSRSPGDLCHRHDPLSDAPQPQSSSQPHNLTTSRLLNNPPFLSLHTHFINMTVIDKVKEALHIGHSDKHDATSTASASTSAPAPAQAQADGETAVVPQLTDTPAFDRARVTVIFVLGGPGAGESAAAHPHPHSQPSSHCWLVRE